MWFNFGKEWTTPKGVDIGIYGDSSQWAFGIYYEYMMRAFSISILCFTFYVGWDYTELFSMEATDVLKGVE